MKNNFSNEKDLGMSLIAFEQNGMWGIKSEKNGEVICDPEYDSITRYNNGYAVISKNKKRGFINIKGERAFEKYCDVREFVNGFAAVELFFERWTFIDETGIELTKKTYREVSDFNSLGYAVVCEELGIYSVINKYGKEIVKKSEFISLMRKGGLK